MPGRPSSRRRTRAVGSRRALPAGPGWLARRWRVALAVLFAVAAAWRVLYVLRVAGTPLAGSLVEDARLYWDWAGFLLRHGPVGQNPFFLGPLYPYVLALVRVAAGDSVTAVLLVQCLWGAAAAALLADAARRLTRPWVGLVAGILAAFYSMAVFFDGLVLMESLVWFLECLLLWLVARTDWARAGGGRLLGLGALIGLLTQARSTSALLLVPALLLARAGARGGASALARRLAALVAGLALVTLPVAVRNHAVSGEWIPSTYNFGFNLYVGNNPAANGTFVSITGTQAIGATAPAAGDGGVAGDGRAYLRARTGRVLGPMASSRWWAAEARLYMREHPGRAAALALRKVAMLWNRREYAQIENVREYEALAGPLGLPFFGSFLFVGMLAIAGLLKALRGSVAARFTAGYALAMTVGLAPFFVTDRYRHHLVPAAILLAAVALDAFWRALARRPRVFPVSLLATLAAGAIIVNWPLPELSETGYAWGMAGDLGARWLDRGRPDLAVAEFERALRLEPPRRAASASLALGQAMLYHNYALALGRLGRTAEALEWHRHAAAAAPEHAVIVGDLADALAAAGRRPEAEALYARLGELPGGAGRSLLGRAQLAARDGDLGRARDLFAQATAAEPDLGAAWEGLLRAQAQQGDFAAAARTLARAGQTGALPPPRLYVYEALLAAGTGDAATARARLALVPPALAAGDPVLHDVIRVTEAYLSRAR